MAKHDYTDKALEYANNMEKIFDDEGNVDVDKYIDMMLLLRQ